MNNSPCQIMLELSDIPSQKDLKHLPSGSFKANSECYSEFGVEDDETNPFNMTQSSDEIPYFPAETQPRKIDFSKQEGQIKYEQSKWIKLCDPFIYLYMPAIMQKAGQDILAYVTEFWCSHLIALTILSLISVVGSMDGPLLVLRSILLGCVLLLSSVFHFILLNSSCMYCMSGIYVLMRLAVIGPSASLVVLMYHIPAFGNLVVTHVGLCLVSFFYLYTDSMGTKELKYRMSRPVDVGFVAFSTSNQYASLLFGVQLIQRFEEDRGIEFFLGIVISLACLILLIFITVEYVNQYFFQKYSVRFFLVTTILLLLIFIFSLVALFLSQKFQTKYKIIFTAAILSTVTTALNCIMTIYRIRITIFKQRRYASFFDFQS